MRIIIIIILYMIPIYAQGFSLFDGLYKKVDEKNYEIKEQVNNTHKDLRAELGVIKDNQITFKNEMKADIKASIQANAKAVAGLDKSITAGRDVNTTTKVYNDSTLLKYIIGSLCAIIMLLIRSRSKMIKQMMKEKQQIVNHLMNMQQSKDKYKKACKEANLKVW